MWYSARATVPAQSRPAARRQPAAFWPCRETLLSISMIGMLDLPGVLLPGVHPPLLFGRRRRGRAVPSGGNAPSFRLGPDEGAVVHRPDGGLRAIVETDLAKDRFHMDLHGRLGDIDLARDGLVRVAIDDATQNAFLARGEPGYSVNFDWS